MFGYVVVNEPELRIREFHLYREYYCGLCMELKDSYGQSGRLTLSYDTTFLALLLTCLYEPEDTVSSTKCIAHPLEKHPTRRNAYTKYAADINILLSYYSCVDDWQDEHKWKKRLMAGLLRGKSQRAGALHAEKAEIIVEKLDALHTIEKSGAQQYTASALIDASSGAFGDIMAEIFDMKGDLWGPTLRRMGCYLGKFIYILDAYDDLEKDAASGSFNPLLSERSRSDFDEYVRAILTMMMAECSSAFETLPIIENVEILRNILYSGVWSKFDLRMRERSDAAARKQQSPLEKGYRHE